MTHIIASKLSDEERTSLAPSVKSHVLDDLELVKNSSSYPQYIDTLTNYLNEILGVDAIIKSLHFWWRAPSEKTRAYLAQYIDARVNNRFTDKTEQSLVKSAGKKQAATLLSAADKALEHKKELLDLLAEYGTAYTDYALSLSAHKKNDVLQISEMNLHKKVGQKRADALKEIISGRIDAELNDYLFQIARSSARHAY